MSLLPEWQSGKGGQVFGRRRGGVVVIRHGGQMERLSVGLEKRESNRSRRRWLRGRKRSAAVGIGLGFWISIPDAY